jgi:serine protease inhibitor
LPRTDRCRVDHPFRFAIREERTRTFLFLGYIAAP